MNSLGFVEVSGVTAAIDALDIMCKSADVSLVSWERKLGGRLVTLIVTGTVSAVQAAVENAAAQCIKKPVATAVIPNPHEETVRLVQLSAKRLEKKEEAPAQATAPAAPKTRTRSTTAKGTSQANKTTNKNTTKGE